MASKKTVTPKSTTKSKTKRTQTSKPISKHKQDAALNVEDTKPETPMVQEEKNKPLPASIPAEPQPELPKISIAPAILWGITFVLGLSFDFLFWEQLAGINYFIFLVLCVLGGWFVLRSSGGTPSLHALLLLIPLAFLLSSHFCAESP